MRNHVKVLSVFHIMFGLGLLSVPFMIRMATQIAAAFPSHVYMPSPQAYILGPDLVLRWVPMWILTPSLVLVGLGGITGAIGLLLRAKWAYPLVLGVGVVVLIDFPLGTALGLYTLWVLTRPQTREILSIQ